MNAPSPARLLSVCCGLLAIAATLYGQHRLGGWFIEDAAISFAYARNLAEGHGLVRFPGDERIEGYSNPMWVAWLALWHTLGWDGFQSSKWTAWLLPLLTLPTTGALIARLRGWGWGSVAMWLLALDATFVIWSASGLENSLFCAFQALLLHRAITETEPGRAPLLPWVALGLSLTRPEGIVYAALGLGTYAVREVRGPKRFRRLTATFLLFLVPFLLYHTVRYGYFAYPFPATYYAKLGEQTFRPLLWHDRGWVYLRNYGDDLLRFWLLPVLLLGTLGERRAWLAALLTAWLGVVLLYPPVEPAIRWGWASLQPPSPVWMKLRLGSLIAVVLIATAGIGRSDGGPTRALAWAMTLAGLLFCLKAGGDWMRGYRWFSLIAVPVTVLLTLGLADGFVLLRRYLGSAPAGAALTLAGLLAVGPQVYYLARYEPETTPFSVLKRVRHYRQAMRKLHLDRAEVLDHDMGAMLYWGREIGIIRDSRGLTDIPFAIHRGAPAFVEEYAFDEYPFDFAHAHGSTGLAVRRVGHRWRDAYIEFPGYGNTNLHVGNYVRKSLLMAPWTGSTERSATFRDRDRELRLLGVEIPAPEVSPGSWLYVELGVQIPRNPQGMRLLLFLHDDEALVASWDLPLGLETYYPVERWGPDEVYDGRLALPLAHDLPLGDYALGAAVLTPSGVLPAVHPDAGPIFVQGEARFEGTAVRLVETRAMGRAAAADVRRALADAEAGHCVRAETWWRRARAHRSMSQDWQASQRPRVFPAIARCYARRAARSNRSNAVDHLRRALRYARTDPEVRRVGARLAERWITAGREARSRSAIDEAYGYFRDAVFVDPSRAWARRWAEELRAERLHLRKP